MTEVSTLSILMDELAEAGLLAEGLERAYAWPAERVEPPCLVVPWPDEVQYAATYGGGIDRCRFPLILVLGRGGTAKQNRDKVAHWMSGNLPSVIESYGYTGEHVVTVSTAETDIVEIAGVAYLAMLFETDVVVQN
jgi:hypothetical protein